ncbi:MAG: hypothetical protein ACOZQL_01200 [Myxococcota bacterium]
MNRTVKLSLLAIALLSTPVLADETGKGSDTPNEATFRRQGALLDRSPQKRNQMLSLFLGLPVGYFYYAGFPFGFGARYDIPILHDGFIPAINDSFHIEFGLDFSGVAGYRTFYPLLAIPVEVMWQFHMTQKLGLYAKLGAALEFSFISYCPTVGPCTGVVGGRPIGNVGLIYKFSEKLSFRAEVGYPWVKVGLGFDM